MASRPLPSRLVDEAEPLLRNGAVRSSSPDLEPPKPAHQLRSDAPRIAAVMFSFIVLGLQLCTIGAMVPHLEAHYRLNDTLVSLIFVVGPLGYLGAACLNGAVHVRFGRRGIAVLGPLFQIVWAVVASLHPPFPAFLAAHAIGVCGMAFLGASWSAWASTMEYANTVLGLLHGSFCIGGALGSSLVGVLLVANRPWYAWFRIMTVISVVELAVLFLAFRSEDAEIYRQRSLHPSSDVSSRARTRVILKSPVTWVCAAYYLTCAGTEAAVSGWVVIFMRRIRHATPYLSSACSSGFWAGMAAGRLSLGIASDRMGVRSSVVGCGLAAIAAQVMFAIAQKPEMSVILMVAVGFFCGPLYPSGIVLLAQLLPREVHLDAVSFVTFIGQVGSAVLPFGMGAMSQALGMQVFRIAVPALLAMVLLIWLAFSRLPSYSPRPESRDAEGPPEAQS